MSFQPNFIPKKMQPLLFSSFAYHGLALFVRRDSGFSEASFSLESAQGVCSVQTLRASFGSLHFDLEEETEYHLSWEHGYIDLAYLDHGPMMLQRGIFPIYGNGNNLPGRNRIHFSPMEGWMNDPNGLCVFGGKMHLFYQYNPFGQVWGNMHWGHAVSDDLVHWIHEPVALFPQAELQDAAGLRGGAFSGSAIVQGSLMSVFFTRNVGDVARTWRKEKQVRTVSEDGIFFHDEHTVLEPHLEHCTGDFRDPKVFPYEDGFLMVVGSCISGMPTVLLYSSKDLESWSFVSNLYVEQDEKYAIAECPDFFLLGGKWVLLVGFINKDRTPQRDVKYIVGSFDGKTFLPESSGFLDEGKDFYATQTMEWKGRRILFGWNSDTRNIYKPSLHGANGTLSLPRELSLKDGRLMQNPAEDIAVLQKEARGVQGTSYMLKISGSPIRSLASILAGKKGLSLSYQENLLVLSINGQKRCTIKIQRLEQLEVFVDTALLELFVNGGEQVASIRYGGVVLEEGKVVSVQIDGMATRVESHQLSPVWS